MFSKVSKVTEKARASHHDRHAVIIQGSIMHHRIESLFSFVSSSNSPLYSVYIMSVMRFCRNCNKSDAHGGLFGAAPNLNNNTTTTLLACSRCKCTYYCSRACQAADYEKHKAVCLSIVKMGRVGQEGPSVDANSFFFRLHYLRIMNEIHRVTHQYSIDKKDIIIELDFCPIAYELRSPAFKGDFLVYPVQQVLVYKRDPSWYHPHRGTTKHDSWMSVYVERVRDIRSRITGNAMMTMVVNTSAGGSVGRFTLTRLGMEAPSSRRMKHCKCFQSVTWHKPNLSWSEWVSRSMRFLLSWRPLKSTEVETIQVGLMELSGAGSPLCLCNSLGRFDMHAPHSVKLTRLIMDIYRRSLSHV